VQLTRQTGYHPSIACREMPDCHEESLLPEEVWNAHRNKNSNKHVFYAYGSALNDQ
jgi:hypothetical protein